MIRGHKKKSKFIVLSALIVTVTGISIGYAAFSTILKINGSSNFTAMNWDVHFEYSTDNSTYTCDEINPNDCHLIPTVSGTAEEIKPPKINDNTTEISYYLINLYNQGDKVEYSFDVVNNGTMDAKLSAINVPMSGVITNSQPSGGSYNLCPSNGNCVTCEGYGSDKVANENTVCSHLSYTLKYSDGTQLNIGDVLGAGERVSFKLTLQYNITTATMPSDDVTISNLSVNLKYVQDV